MDTPIVPEGINPFEVHDPWASYREVLGQPVWFYPQENVFLFTGSVEDAKRIVADHATWASDRLVSLNPATQSHLLGVLATLGMTSISEMDPPRHTALRETLTRALTPRSVNRLRPQIRERVIALLDGINPANVAMPVLTRTLSIGLVADLLGVAEQEIEVLTELAEQVKPVVEEFAVLDDQSVELLMRFQGHLDGMVSRRVEMKNTSGSHQDDLIGSLLSSCDNGKITLEEAKTNIMAVFLAGYDSTSLLLCNLVRLFSEHPAEFEKLRENRDLLAPAVEEVLWHEPSFHTIVRFAREDTVLCGSLIPKGSDLHIFLPIVNADGAPPETTTFDVEANRSQSMSFGFGAHYCIGASLARAEAQEFLDELLDRYTGLRVLEASNRPFHSFRGYEKLEVCMSEA